MQLILIIESITWKWEQYEEQICLLANIADLKQMSLAV
jgi:hypothetical protein